MKDISGDSKIPKDIKSNSSENAKSNSSADSSAGMKFQDIEQEILDFWSRNSIYQKIRAKNKNKQKFFFVQGPPYTSGRLHIGHAWNNSLKDIALRFKRMNNFDVFDRASYDMHGLPTERKVMELHKLEWKEDIEKFGVEKFIRECIKWSTEKAELMSKDLQRLGVWMDFENPALPIKNSYIEGEWFLIKKAHENKRLYQGLRTLNWCPICQTAMAKHECDYKTITEPSVFVKFPVKDSPDEFLVIWTTTPWTLVYNLAIMVNPEVDYVKARVGNEIWILAKALAAPVIQAAADRKFTIIEEFRGKSLEGLEYVHPWQDKIPQFKEIKKKHPKTHTIILSEEYVDTTAGSGLVHCAPGCGPEDYEVGYRNNLPPFNNLLENGLFPDEIPEFKGLKAKKDDKIFIKELEKQGMLVATTPIEHEYPHCERCRTPVVFRATKQWFFKVEELKQKMIEANEKILWIPDSGKNAFRSWLNNLRDNSITKQRFWGTPVPIWQCSSCNNYEVIGSISELKEKAITEIPENLHKPWLDSVKLKCKCNSEMNRIPDVLDVWIDAGTLSWNILDYPKNQELFKKLYPADFILEAREQIRGWFNLLMVSSFIAFNKPCFNACYMHGMLTDVEGVKMSKSLGNVISPYEIVDKYGADVLRYYMCQTKAGEDIKFSWEEIKLKQRNLLILWNLHKYLIDFYKTSGIGLLNFNEVRESPGPEEFYILSRMESTTKSVTELLNNYSLDQIIAPIEELFIELSRTYIQLIREKTSGTELQKQAILYTLFTAINRIITLFSPVCPFITEEIYQNLRQEFSSGEGLGSTTGRNPAADKNPITLLKEESIHLKEWPKTEKSLINPEIEQDFETLKAILQAIHFAREKAQLGLKWPVKEVLIASPKELYPAIKRLNELIKAQANIKNLTIIEKLSTEKEIRIDYPKFGKKFGNLSPEITARIEMLAQNELAEQLENSTLIIKIKDAVYNITKDYFIIKETLPSNIVSCEFSCKLSEPREGSMQGNVYLDKTRTPELEAEGFAREIIRKIQSARKDEKLNKTDRIELFLQTDIGLESRLIPYLDSIKEKTGSERISLLSIPPSRKYKIIKQEKIRDKNISLMFNKIPDI